MFVPYSKTWIYSKRWSHYYHYYYYYYYYYYYHY